MARPFVRHKRKDSISQRTVPKPSTDAGSTPGINGTLPDFLLRSDRQNKHFDEYIPDAVYSP